MSTIAYWQARAMAAEAVIAARDALEQHREVCNHCSQRDGDNPFWDDGLCPRWTRLVDAESQAFKEWRDTR